MIDTPTKEERTFSARLRCPEWKWTWGSRGQRCLLRPRREPSLEAVLGSLLEAWNRNKFGRYPNA